MKKKFSIILPIYKNEGNLPVTVPFIMERLNLFSNYDVEIIMVCDGSPDNSYKIMEDYQRKYPEKIKIAKFARNCGQRAAVNCGMKLADGDFIGVISADLQDPFELFVEMLKYCEEGNPLVIACRKGRKEKGIGAACSQLLHKFINKNINHNYPVGGFDFFVVNRTIAEAFVRSDTKNNSMQLLLLELAGSAKQLEYIRQERKIGTSGWNLSRKMDQVLNIMTVYSDKPFIVLGVAGILSICIGLLMIIASFIFLVIGYSTSLYLGIYGIGILIAGAVFLVGGILGIYGFKGMQNANCMPRYIITDIKDETRGKE